MHIYYVNHRFSNKKLHFSERFFYAYNTVHWYWNIRNSTTIWEFDWTVTPYTYTICTVVLRNTLTVQSFCFLAELSCKFVRLPKLTEVGTNWYKLVQVGTSWYKLVQIGTNWYKIAMLKIASISTMEHFDWLQMSEQGSLMPTN